MREPTLSIIIPAKNEEQNIVKCIESLLNIDYDKKLIEIIVVDNGSDDHTKDKAEELGIKVLELKNGTISELRNLGAKESHGDILAFIDSDVFVEKCWFKNALKCFQETNAICVGCSPWIPDNNTWIERAWHYQMQVRPARYERDWLPSMNMLVKKAAFNAIGGFNPKLYTCEDVDLGYKLRKCGKIVFDKSIEAVHVGEAKTIYGFFKKESWRGIGNFDGIMQHGVLLEEIPSNMIAGFYFVIYPVLITALLFGYYKLLATLIMISLIMPIFITIKLLKIPNNTLFAIQIYLIWAIYCYARGFSGYIYLKRKLIS